MAPPQRRQKKRTSDADLVRDQLPILRILTKTKSAAVRRDILFHSPNSVKAISSIATNLMHGSIPISPARTNDLKKKFGKIVYLVASPKSSLANKKKAIQKGGFLPLLGRVLPAIASLLGQILK